MSIGAVDDAANLGAEFHSGSVDPEQATDETDSARLQRGEIDGAVIRAAHELKRGLGPAGRHVGHVVDGLVERADHLEPSEYVDTPVQAGQPAVMADRESHVASAAAELVGQLDPGGRRPHDEHATRRNVLRCPIARGNDLMDVSGQVTANSGNRGPVAPAGGDDEVVGPDRGCR